MWRLGISRYASAGGSVLPAINKESRTRDHYSSLDLEINEWTAGAAANSSHSIRALTRVDDFENNQFSYQSISLRPEFD